MTTKPDFRPTTSAQEIEAAIIEIAAGMKMMNATRLKRSTIVALIHDKSNVPKKTIELVLNNLDDFENLWLRPKAAV